MERQIIERLAMDAAMGELNEDAQALLDTYLAEHPDAKQQARQITTLCERTQKAIDIKTQRKSMSIITPVARRWASIPLAVAVRWAAVIVVSLIVGAGMDRWRAPRTVAPVPRVAVETARSDGSESWQQILNEPDKGFWATKAAAMLQSQPHQSADPQPSLLEALRHLQKGYNYERSRQ